MVASTREPILTANTDGRHKRRRTVPGRQCRDFTYSNLALSESRRCCTTTRLRSRSSMREFISCNLADMPASSSSRMRLFSIDSRSFSSVNSTFRLVYSSRIWRLTQTQQHEQLWRKQQDAGTVDVNNRFYVFSKRQRITLRLLYAMSRPSVCLSVCLLSVCDVGAPYSGG